MEKKETKQLMIGDVELTTTTEEIDEIGSQNVATFERGEGKALLSALKNSNGGFSENEALAVVVGIMLGAELYRRRASEQENKS